MASVNTLTRTAGLIRVINEATDSPSMSSVVGSQVTRSLWADAVATTLTFGGGASHTATNLRISGSTKLALSATQVSITNADLTCAGAGATSERFGAGALAGGLSGSAFGNGASAGGTQSTAVGSAASAGGGSATAVGQGAGAAGLSATAVGGGASAAFTQSTALGVNALCGSTNATALGANSQAGLSTTAVGSGAVAPATTFAVVVGTSATASFTSSIVLGAGAADTAANQFVAGSDTAPITTVVIGRGPTSATPSALVTWRATDATAASAAAGSSLTVRAGNGDGVGANGVLTLTDGSGGTGGGGMTLTALGGSVTLNQTGSTALSGFTATSIVGALNELVGGSAQSTISQINDNAGTISLGQVVYHTTTTGRVDLATAAADNAAARAWGVVTSATIATTVAGSVAIVGQRRALKFEASLTLTVGDEIYLSATTAGSVTNVAPATSGQVIQTLGVIDDLTVAGNTYNGGANLLAFVIFTLGPKAVV